MYVYRWNRQGRKGELCRITARGRMNSVRVEFADGYVMITSGNAVRKARDADQFTLSFSWADQAAEREGTA